MPADLALATAMLAYVADTAPVLAMHLDAQQRVRAPNAYARRVLGDDVAGRPLTDLVPEFTPLPNLAVPPDAVTLVTLNTVTGLPDSFHFRFFAVPDGTLALGSLDVQEQSRLQATVLGLNRELNNLTRQLHQANAELCDLNALKSRFIGMAAHDLRRPVGVIMTHSEFVLDEAGGRLDDEQRQLLRASLAAATGMKRLIDNFLDVSVIESGNLRLERSRTTVADVVAGVLPLVHLIATRKKVALIVDGGDDQHPVRIDGAKLQQVLVNLLGNAIEHSGAGQRVWLAASRRETDLMFSVRDEGPGIAREAQQRLFAPFAQAGTRKTAGERSVGLGLAIARLVVEAHGGRLWVESEPGHGSTFFVTLPTSSADDPA